MKLHFHYKLSVAVFLATVISSGGAITLGNFDREVTTRVSGAEPGEQTTRSFAAGAFSGTASVTAPFGDGSVHSEQNSSAALINSNLVILASGSITDNITSRFRDHFITSRGSIYFSLDAPGYFTLTGTTTAISDPSPQYGGIYFRNLGVGVGGSINAEGPLPAGGHSIQYEVGGSGSGSYNLELNIFAVPEPNFTAYSVIGGFTAVCYRKRREKRVALT